MAIEKISESDVNRLNVKSAPDIPDGDSTSIKQIFDNLPEHIVKKFNELVDSLLGNGEGQSGADNLKSASIEGITGETVREQLKSIVALVLDRHTKAEIASLISSATNTLVSEVDVNLTSGEITIRKKDGTTKTINTEIEKIPSTFEFIEEGGKWYIKVTNLDGTSTKADVSRLMNLYEFENSEHISFVTSGDGTKTVSAIIKDGSIGLEKLSITAITNLESTVNACNNAKNEIVSAKEIALQAKDEVSEKLTETRQIKGDIDTKSSLAETAKQSAEESKKMSQSYAVGGSGIRVGEDVDNAKYYAQKAKEEADRAGNIAGGDFATKADLSAETNARTEVINAEVQARTQALQAETQARNTAIEAETNARTQKDTELTNALQAEKQAREAEDNKLVTTAEGVHGVRYHQGTLGIYIGDKWQNIYENVVIFDILHGVSINPDGSNAYAGLYMIDSCITPADPDGTTAGGLITVGDNTEIYINEDGRMYVKGASSNWRRIDIPADSYAPSGTLPNDVIFQVYE